MFVLASYADKNGFLWVPNSPLGIGRNRRRIRLKHTVVRLIIKHIVVKAMWVDGLSRCNVSLFFHNSSYAFAQFSQDFKTKLLITMREPGFHFIRYPMLWISKNAINMVLNFDRLMRASFWLLESATPPPHWFSLIYEAYMNAQVLIIEKCYGTDTLINEINCCKQENLHECL